MNWNRSRSSLAIAFLVGLTLLVGPVSRTWAQESENSEQLSSEIDSTPFDSTPFDSRGIRGSLIIAGGGRLDESILDRFIELAGDEHAKLIVIPTASESADRTDKDPLEPWRKYETEQLHVLHTRDRAVANDPKFVAPIQDATAVWISGGSQTRLAEAYQGTAVERELHALLKRGGVIGGTSAGAAILSRTMIASGKETPEILMGLGLLPGAIIDQHFLARNRQARSEQAVTLHPEQFGLGIDEETAVEVQGRQLKVLGDSVVTIMLAASENRPARTITLKPGQRADLTALRRAAVARTRARFPKQKVDPPIVASGSLVIVGGGGVTDSIADRFVELAGGPQAKIVVLPTAGADASARRTGVPSFLRDRETESIEVLPQRWRDEVDSPEFQSALSEATGVWFGGGRQWRFVDAYEDTEAAKLFDQVLERGGVIGGSSAGASIQAEYMVRGHPLGNEVLMAEGYEQGLGFLKGVAIDQHLTQRGRLDDLRSVIEQFPQLLGIGLDESTAIVVQGSEAEVLGEHDVHFLDHSAEEPRDTKLSAGQHYDLVGRAESTWGQFVDPDGNCKFTLAQNQLTLTAPGPIHDLSVELGRMNAPRMLRSVEDDFTIEVCVSGEFGSGDSTLELRTAYQGAGLLLMRDDDTYVRLERATLVRAGVPRHYINFEAREFSRFKRFGRPDDGRLKGGVPVWLRLTRAGNTIRGSFREGKEGPWIDLNPKEVELPDGIELKIGVAAVNASTIAFNPLFSDYKIGKAIPDEIQE